MKLALADRFWSKVDRSAGTGACWPWLAGRNGVGYGQISTTRKSGPMLAHRLSWLLAHGSLSPFDGTRGLVLHRCNNPVCVNPGHLYVGDRSDNFRDCITAGTHPQTRKTTCPRGHVYDHVTKKGRRECLECRRLFARLRAARYRAQRKERAS